MQTRKYNVELIVCKKQETIFEEKVVWFFQNEKFGFSINMNTTTSVSFWMLFMALYYFRFVMCVNIVDNDDNNCSILFIKKMSFTKYYIFGNDYFNSETQT